MTHNDLCNSILYLIPDAKMVIWELINENDTYHGENEPIDRFGFKVDWKGPGDCPTEETISNLSLDAVNAAAEIRRKTARDNAAMNDMSFKNGLVVYQLRNPNANMTDYLDYLENI